MNNNFFKAFFNSLVNAYIEIGEKRGKEQERIEERKAKEVEKPEEKEEKKEEKEKKVIKRIFPIEKISAKELNEFVYLPGVESVQCIEDQNIVIAYKDRVETKEVKLNKTEAMDIIKKISEKTRIPVQKEFNVYFEDFFIQAWLDDKIKLIIKKIV